MSETVTYQVVLLDSIGSFLLKEPTYESISFLIKILPNDFFSETIGLMQKILEEEKISEVVDLYNHYFEIPSHCTLTSHQSATVYGRKKPEFLDTFLNSIGVKFKVTDNRMPDHIGNLVLILAIIVKNIEDTENEDSVRNQVKLLEKFVNRHLLSFIDILREELNGCNCNDQVNVFKGLMGGLIPLVKTIRDNAVDIRASIA